MFQKTMASLEQKLTVENALSCIFKLDPDLHLGFVQRCERRQIHSNNKHRTQTLARFQDKWHPFPTRVVDPERRRGKRRAH
jgi:hypothetical protein